MGLRILNTVSQGLPTGVGVGDLRGLQKGSQQSPEREGTPS